MKGTKLSIKLLNHALKNELTATNQLFLHARMYKNWGLETLNEHSYKASIKAMKQADKLINRVLFLEGLPNLQDLGKLRIGEDPQEMLTADLTLFTEMHKHLQQAVNQTETEADYVSRELLESILGHTEEHIDWLETQQSLIKEIGVKNYLQKMM